MKDFLKKAQKAERAGDYATAGDFFAMAGETLKALAAYRRGNLHAQAAKLAVDIGDYAAAANAYGLANDCRSAGELWLKAEQPDRAWRMYKRSGDLRTAGEILEKMGKPLDAAQLYEQAGLKEPAARLYAGHERPEDALRLLEALIQETNRDTIHLESTERAQRIRRFSEACGKLCLKIGKPQKAAAHLENAGLLVDAGRAYRAAGQSQKAVEVLMKAGRDREAADLIDEQDTSSFDPRTLAELMLKRGDHLRAAENFLRAGDPSMAMDCFEQAGELLRAAEAARAARDPMSAGRLYRRVEKWKEAAQQYQEANAQAEAADCLARSGDSAGAAERYLAGREYLKGARILFGRGELDRCIEVLQQIPRDADDADEASLLLGQIFEEKSLFTLAADCYRKALGARAVDKETLPVVYRLARVLEKCNRPDEARPLYTQIAAVDFKYEDVAARVTALSQAAGAAGGGAQDAPPGPTLHPLEEKYEKQEALGQGRGGPLFLARERSSGRQVRIVRLAIDPGRDAAKVERLLQEARRIASLRHPGIVPLLEANVDAKGIYYVSEHREGRKLSDTLKEGGLPDFGTVWVLLSRLAEALDYAHAQGVLCRNLRPENVWVTSQQDILMVDFGLAFRLTESSGSPEGEAALRYAPPELLLRERLDVRSDLYCLGLVGLEASIGLDRGGRPGSAGLGEAPRFPEPTVRPVPSLIRKVIERCLERDRNHRYPAARDLLAELQGAQLLPGAIVANRYEVVREAGRGGMGEVYEARDLVLDERVALKTVSGAIDDDTQKRFLNEIKLARKITHPNVVRVFTFEQWRDLRFIVMEFIDGQGLMQWLKKHGLPSIEVVAQIGQGVADGLARAHALGIVHRDIKPDNILIDASGTPRILDFGIARVSDSNLTQAGMTIGSPKYMSPEQIEGKALDGRSDIYALGLVLYLALTGREAFQGPSAQSILAQQLQMMPARPRAVRPEVPDGMERLLLRMISKDPAARPQSATEISQAFAALSGSGAPAPAAER